MVTKFSCSCYEWVAGTTWSIHESDCFKYCPYCGKDLDEFPVRLSIVKENGKFLMQETTPDGKVITTDVQHLIKGLNL